MDVNLITSRALDWLDYWMPAYPVLVLLEVDLD